MKRSYFLFCCLMVTYCMGTLPLWKAETPGIRSQAVYLSVAPFNNSDISSFNNVNFGKSRLSGDLYIKQNLDKRIFSAQTSFFNHAGPLKTFCSLIKLNNIESWRGITEFPAIKNSVLKKTNDQSFLSDERSLDGFGLIVKIPDKIIHSL